MGRLLALICAVAGALDNTAHCPRAFVPARAGGFRMQLAPAQGCCVLGAAMSASILDKNGVEICHFERRHGLYIAKVQLENPMHEGFGRPGPVR